METEPHHPSWQWRVELWLSTALTLVGTVVALVREPRLDGAALMLGVGTAVLAVVLVAAYVREGGRRQREEQARARDHVA